MDSGISDMINGVLSNPDALNKLMTIMPAVAQMMNGGGSGDLNTPNNLNILNNLNNLNDIKIKKEKTAETAAVSADTNNMPAENLLANAGVMAALKNLITALNAASSVGAEIKPAAAAVKTETQAADNPDGKIEKTLDTLKNFSSATSPESDHRSRLLLALKPFLKDTRKTKIDTAIKYMNAAKIINLFGKNGFV